MIALRLLRIIFQFFVDLVLCVFVGTTFALWYVGLFACAYAYAAACWAWDRARLILS